MVMVIMKVSYRLLHFFALHIYLVSCNLYPFVGAIYADIFELVMVITNVSYRLLHFFDLHFYLVSCNFYPFVGAI